MENLNLPSTYQNNNNTVLRAAIYIRVSSSEQAMHGFSLEAQKEYLEAYAKQNGMRVVGVYADEGKSASKCLYRRKELLRMISDMEAGDIDVIIFKDITRWSRNSSHYHRIQERIDAAGGYWIAAQQPYLETRTPTGRYQVTIMLGNAQLESENTSERIKFVQASRLPKGAAIWGSDAAPMGYEVKEVDGMKRVVKKESEAEMVMAAFEHYELTHSIGSVQRFMSEKYNRRMGEKSVRKFLSNTLFKGEYKGVDNYCEPYISAERWENIQAIRRNRTQYPRKNKYVFMFSGLAKCAECGANLNIVYNEVKGKRYAYYRCRNYTQFRKCEHKACTRDEKLEAYMLENIEDEMNKYIQHVTITNVEPPNTEKKRKALERKAKNLRELYIDGDIEKDEYLTRKEDYEKQIAELPVYKKIDTKKYEDFLNSDWRVLYDELDNMGKRVFWRSIVDKIVIDNNQNKRIYFLD